MGFGSLGMSELLVIFAIVLVAFGPRRFPEIARSMGSAMREFRRSLNQIQRELEEADPRKDLPGKDILDDIRKGPAGWLDPKRPAAGSGSGTPSAVSAGTPALRSAAGRVDSEITGEAAGSAEAPASADASESGEPTAPEEAGEDDPAGGEQLPIFDEPPPEPSTDDSRSG